MKTKLFVIDTSDQRCKYLYRMIKEKGYHVELLDTTLIDSYPVCIMIFSPSKVLQLSDVNRFKKGSTIFGGNISLITKDFLQKSNLYYSNLLEDEIFLLKNTLPTAEGCLQLIIENTDKTFHDLKTLILGYGRVSKTLSSYLLALGVNTHIYSIDKKEINLALLNTNGILKTLVELQDFDVIINTIPATILNNVQMNSINKDCFFCDLASGNYVDMDELLQRNITAIKASALPGKVSPHSAATYLYTSIFDTLNSKEMNL